MACIAVDKELIVAGFVNQNPEGTKFTFDDLLSYISTLWNYGYIIRANYTKEELLKYLEKSRNLDCVSYYNQINNYIYFLMGNGFIKKEEYLQNVLNSDYGKEVINVFDGNIEKAKSFIIFQDFRLNLSETMHFEYSQLYKGMGFNFQKEDSKKNPTMQKKLEDKVQV